MTLRPRASSEAPSLEWIAGRENEWRSTSWPATSAPSPLTPSSSTSSRASRRPAAPPRVVVAGLGKSGEFSVDKVRALSADLARFLRRGRLKHAAVITHGAGIAGLDAEACAQAIAEGTLLGL